MTIDPVVRPRGLSQQQASGAGTVPQAPGDPPRRSRALVTAGGLILLMAFAGALVLTLGNSGSSLSQKPGAPVLALLGIVAVWAAAMVIALALCGMAAAGDRTIVDGATEALRARPELPMPFANLEWPTGQRRRYGTSGAREPAAPASASGTPRASARAPARS
jgi:hypothetical protein